MAKKINPEIVAKVQTYIDQLSTKKGADKVGRLLAKSFSADAKFNRTITSDPSKGLSFFTDAEKRGKILDLCAEAYGLTSIDQKRAMSIKMLSEDVDVAVERKRLELTSRDTMVLNDEQKAALTKWLVGYRTFLLTKLAPAALKVAEELGVLVEEPVAEPVAAN